MGETAAQALVIEKLSHRFRAVEVLREVSLTVAPGTVTALLGPNGAGKTTLFNLVTRLFSAHSGRISICGHDLARSPRAALASLGVVFQSRALDPSLTVRQNLRYAIALHGVGGREAEVRASTLLGRLDIENLADRPVRTLSGGQAQRAEIARAMMHEPRLLLCDEATAGLDIEARRALVSEVRRLASEDGVGVLWATHLTDEIDQHDRVVVLNGGEVLATGTAAALAGRDGLEDSFLQLIGEDASA